MSSAVRSSRTAASDARSDARRDDMLQQVGAGPSELQFIAPRGSTYIRRATSGPICGADSARWALSGGELPYTYKTYRSANILRMRGGRIKGQSSSQILARAGTREMGVSW